MVDAGICKGPSRGSPTASRRDVPQAQQHPHHNAQSQMGQVDHRPAVPCRQLAAHGAIAVLRAGKQGAEHRQKQAGYKVKQHVPGIQADERILHAAAEKLHHSAIAQ